MKNYSKEWYQKATIDYFAPFISLWLGCNSWYRFHYPEVGKSDRNFIDKIKSDFSKRNHLFQEFEDCLLGSDKKKTVNFKTNLELLMFSLNRVSLKPDNLIYNCSFNYFLIDYNKKADATAYMDITITPKLKANGSLHKDYEDKVIKLDSAYIVSDIKLVFSGLFELIYQIRNMVVHGSIKPERDEHDVVKYCFMILSDLVNI